VHPVAPVGGSGAFRTAGGLKHPGFPDDNRPEHGLLGGARDRRNQVRHRHDDSVARTIAIGWGSVMLEDVSITALHSALRGLAARQRAVSDDIANVNTPYYRAKSVAFEGDLRDALESGADPMGVAPTVSISNAPVGLTFSNVDLNAETMSSVNTQLAYDLAVRATGDRFTLLRTAVKGG
jgi:flagellar basal-body rod protein FlgB